MAWRRSGVELELANRPRFGIWKQRFARMMVLLHMEETVSVTHSVIRNLTLNEISDGGEFDLSCPILVKCCGYEMRKGKLKVYF